MTQKIRPEDVKWGEVPDDVEIETDDNDAEGVDPTNPNELASWLRVQTGEVDD